MARLDQHWILKGGYAIQLRTERARTTQDVDLLVVEISVQDIENTFRKALEKDLGDYFVFIISKSGAVGAGEHSVRFQVISRVAGRIFERFHVDVGYTDPLLQPIDYLTPPNYLAFAQIEAASIPCYSIYQHIAEKVHAIRRPRNMQSARVHSRQIGARQVHPRRAQEDHGPRYPVVVAQGSEVSAASIPNQAQQQQQKVDRLQLGSVAAALLP